MTAPTLITPRLMMRALATRDAPAIAAALSNYEVIRWLTSPPWPYRLSDAEWFVTSGMPNIWAITAEDALIGVVGLGGKGDLGYWLAADHHGQGYMTEAARAVLGWHFKHSDESVTSGHLVKNLTSRNTLLKLGFEDTHTIRTFSEPLGRDVPVQRMVLTDARWQTLRERAQ